MEPLIDQLDLKKTRIEARKHLLFLGKKVMHQEIMEYIHYTNSIISNSDHNNSAPNKVLGAIDRKSVQSNTISYYIKMIITNLNKLEEEHRTALLSKYLYKFDDEEMERQMNKSMASIKRTIRDAEVDFAIAMHCTISKKERKNIQ